MAKGRFIRAGQRLNKIQIANGFSSNSVTPVVKSNDIANQYAREGTAFSFTVPADTFTGEGITYDAYVMRETQDLSLSRFWLDFDSGTRAFSGTPTGFDDEQFLQIEVVATDSGGNTASAWFSIVVYEAGTSTTTVLPRTSAECDYVITSANNDTFDWALVSPGETIGISGSSVGRIEPNDLNGDASIGPVLITNVDGAATLENEASDRAIYALHSNYFKILGQYDETTDDIYGLKCQTGDDGATKSDVDGIPLPNGAGAGQYDYSSNLGGTAIEIAGNCQNGIEVAYVGVPHSASAGIKIRTETVRYEYTLNGAHTISGGSVVVNESIGKLVPQTGRIKVGADDYAYSSWSGSTFTLTGSLTANYTDLTAVHTCTGIRSFSDMTGVQVHDCLLEYIDTEPLYVGVGFYNGRADSGTTLYPHDIYNCRIERNICKYAGWDGIQVKNTVEDCKIRWNYAEYCGHREESGQAWGMFLAGLVEDCSFNTIKTCWGNGLRPYMIGPSNIFMNVFIDCGKSATLGDSNVAGFYGAIEGEVITAYSQDEGGYVLSSYKSRTDLGTVLTDLDVNIYNNTFYGYGAVYAYRYFSLMNFNRGNNLFVDGGTSTSTGGGGTNANLGGDLLGQAEAQVDFYDVANDDLRIEATSTAAGNGVNLTATVGTEDFNGDTLDATYDTGAYVVDGTVNTDNYINL